MVEFIAPSRDDFNNKCPEAFKELWLDTDLLQQLRTWQRLADLQQPTENLAFDNLNDILKSEF